MNEQRERGALYRDAKGLWFWRGVDRDGRRVQRSTGTTDRAAAERVAAQLAARWTAATTVGAQVPAGGRA